MSLIKRIKNYHFEIRHLIVFFIILASFQTILSYVNSTSTSNVLSRTMELYRKDSAENLADLTATSLEMLLEHELSVENTPASRKASIREFNIILSQQMLQQNVSRICILIPSGERFYAIDDGEQLYSYFFDKKLPRKTGDAGHLEAIHYYSNIRTAFARDEEIRSFVDDSHTFHVLVPFVPMGEFAGAVYMKISPDFSNIASVIRSGYSETGAIFSALILVSLLVMFYMSSYMLNERDQAQLQLFEERKTQIKREIEHEKEALFARRIYHAHHKAEKVMGFIKGDIRSLTAHNLDGVKNKIIKYANFVSRVIYDMKTYDPPVTTIRNPLFRTDINELIGFLVKNIFGRVYRSGHSPEFRLELDESLPQVSINEYVIWEILEPLIQNSIDHNPDRQVIVCIRTQYFADSGESRITIGDNGDGIPNELLEWDERGIRRIFLEHTSTKSNPENSGYGCYLAYEISKNRCGWRMDAQNRPEGGAQFIITIPGKKEN